MSGRGAHFGLIGLELRSAERGAQLAHVWRCASRRAPCAASTPTEESPERVGVTVHTAGLALDARMREGGGCERASVSELMGGAETGLFTGRGTGWVVKASNVRHLGQKRGRLSKTYMWP